MNAAIRSVVRGALAKDCEVLGIRRGYAGLIAGDVEVLGSRNVGEMMQRGGTILGSSRSEEYKTERGQAEAIRQLHSLGVEGLIVIGGNGSQAGAYALARRGFPVVGITSTIDNDLYGFDTTIGVDTALNVALEAIDRLKTTASSHERAFLVEVMGRDNGYLALMAGLAGGAEAIVLPELDIEPEALAATIRTAYERGKPHAIIVVAEGARQDGEALEAYFSSHKDLGFELRLTKLGHVQRGGVPGVADRLLGLRLGFEATQRLLAGQHGIVVGLRSGEVTSVSLSDIVKYKKTLDLELLEMADVLAT
jgi:6-phosphofructokinase 1